LLPRTNPIRQSDAHLPMTLKAPLSLLCECVA
jgi:hypothetical protein